MSECIFCKIVSGEIPATLVYEDGDILGFEDIHPIAPVHILFIPRKHIASLDEVDESQEALLGRVLLAAANLARKRGVAQKGYRVLTNCNADAGQEVFHLHFHLLGGRKMGAMG